ncbi:MAG TPA: type II toxin-antitoxin system VapC family toxin [Turneriella sp.]|nr:type II toxin-antitoxin system VapC family toxin [Turneriella sp.]HNN01713.1 type II toxin-antitoxin system VapC family toxin [Turneriella sp.]
MKYLLDTNVCIQVLRGSLPQIKSRIAAIRHDQIGIPAIVRFELVYGAWRSSNPEQKVALVQNFTSAFASVPVTNDVADSCGKIRAMLEKLGKPIGPYDLLIAATALANGLVLVTHNTREFMRIPGIQLEDWEQ